MMNISFSKTIGAIAILAVFSSLAYPFSLSASVIQPNDISGLALWLKGDTTDGIIKMNSEESAFSFDSSFDKNFTFFVIEDQKPGLDQQEVSTSQGMNWQSTRNGRGLVYETANLSDVEVSLDWIKDDGPNMGIETFRYDGANKLLQFNNGTGILTKTEPAIGNLGLSGSLTVGELVGGGENYEGDIKEIIIYKKALTDTEISEVDNYLIRKYDLKSDRKPQIVFDGDSLTAGTGSTDGQDFPRQAIDLLGGNGVWASSNYAVEGQTVASMSLHAASQLDVPVVFDVLKPQNILSLWGGTNDLQAGADAPTTYARIVSYAQARRKAGYKVVVSTILPRTENASSKFETERQKLNADIRNNWRSFADALSDAASDPRIGLAGDETNLMYYIDDQTHLTNAGYSIVASYFIAAVKQLENPDIPVPVASVKTTVPQHGTGTSMTSIIASSTLASTTQASSTQSGQGRFLDGFLLQYRHVLELTTPIYLWISYHAIFINSHWRSYI